MSEIAWNVQNTTFDRCLGFEVQPHGRMLVVVVVIHVGIIFGTYHGAASGPLMKEMLDIKASVEQPKALAQGAAAAAAGSGQAAAADRHRAGIQRHGRHHRRSSRAVATRRRRPAPPARIAARPSWSRSRVPTRIPPYPTISQRLGEQGTTLIAGCDLGGRNVNECKVAKPSAPIVSISAACDYVKGHWRWQPPTQEGKPVAANTDVTLYGT